MTFNLTGSGINAMLRALRGDTIEFTRVAIGNGAVQNPITATALSNSLMSLTISAITVANQAATLTVAKITNANVDSAFRLTEAGIFAKDQDDSNAEILYAYACCSEADADRVASSGDNVLEEQFSVDAYVGNAANVSALINESLVYATKAAFDAHVADTANPHGVTKTQVGLGNVPNVGTNDQTPTFTEATVNAELTSGEKLSQMLGKIARAVKKIYAHVTATGNVHSATPAQIGAAASSHQHNVSDFTVGTLGVARGGTGVGSWIMNRLIYPSGTGELSQLPFPAMDGMVLHQSPNTPPVWSYASAAETFDYQGNNQYGSGHMSEHVFAEGKPSIIILNSEPASSLAKPLFSWGILFVGAGYGFSVSVAYGGEISYNPITVVTFREPANRNKVAWYGTNAAAQMNTLATYHGAGIR